MNILYLYSDTASAALPAGLSGHALAASRLGDAAALHEREHFSLLLSCGAFAAKAAQTLRKNLGLPAASLVTADDRPGLRRLGRRKLDAWLCTDDALADNLLCAGADPYRVLRCAGISELGTLCERVLRRAARPKGRDGVLICGAYGKHNGGDNAILSAIVSQLRELDPDLPICALSRRPRETARSAGIRSIFIFNLWKSARYLRTTRLYLSGGGTLMQDATSTRSLLFYLLSLRQAKRAGCRTMLYGCGIGPLLRERNRRRVGRTLNSCAEVIAVRDRYSEDFLRFLGVSLPLIRLTADPALRITPPEADEAWLRTCGLEPGKRYALIALRPWDGFAAHIDDFAAAADHLYTAHGCIPVLYALEPERDEPALQSVAARIRVPYLSLRSGGYDLRELALVGRMSVVLSMRLHALVFAAGQNVPLVGVVYDPKVSSFLDYLGCGGYLSLHDVSTDTLFRLIDEAIDRTPDETGYRRLRELAGENSRLAAELLKDTQTRKT